jgi:hypothetical protein
MLVQRTMETPMHQIAAHLIVMQRLYISQMEAVQSEMEALRKGVSAVFERNKVLEVENKAGRMEIVRMAEAAMKAVSENEVLGENQDDGSVAMKGGEEDQQGSWEEDTNDIMGAYDSIEMDSDKDDMNPTPPIANAAVPQSISSMNEIPMDDNDYETDIAPQNAENNVILHINLSLTHTYFLFKQLLNHKHSSLTLHNLDNLMQQSQDMMDTFDSSSPIRQQQHARHATCPETPIISFRRLSVHDEKEDNGDKGSGMKVRTRYRERRVGLIFHDVALKELVESNNNVSDTDVKMEGESGMENVDNCMIKKEDMKRKRQGGMCWSDSTPLIPNDI